MADQFSAFTQGDSQLQAWQEELMYGSPDIPRKKELEKLLSDRTMALAKEAGVGSYYLGAKGTLRPNYAYSEESGPQYAELLKTQEELRKTLANKEILEATPDKGIYQKSTYSPKGTLDPNDYEVKPNPFDTNKLKKFYDASGRQLTAGEMANTATGRGFAAAGWDIGFGPGMIAPGVKADTTERDEFLASQRERRDSGSKSVSQTQQPISQPMTPSPTPPTPPPPPPPPPPVKTAPIDTILFDDSVVPIEIMTDLIFEDIGGQEIISIVRNDTVNGQNIIYQPIKNLSLINQQYNPNNILALQGTSDKYFENFILKLPSKIPNVGNGPNGTNVYIDSNTGDIIVELVNLDQDEQAEIQFRIDGTIYEAEL